MLRKKIREEYGSILNQITKIEEKLNGMPEGKLLFSRSQNNTKWYVSDGHKKVYLPKRNRDIAEQLAAKKYLMSELEYLRKEKRALESYLRHSPEKSEYAEQLFEQDSDFSELLKPYLKARKAEHVAWMEAVYEKNMKYPENLIHKTSSGIFVRSKSEAMIELFLHTNQIPFRYESALMMNQVTLYPDFTIMHPKTGKIYYWEHFGRMDDMGYVRGVSSKIQLYASAGIVPSIHLITTYETKMNPLAYDEVVRVGSQYFL